MNGLTLLLSLLILMFGPLDHAPIELLFAHVDLCNSTELPEDNFDSISAVVTNPLCYDEFSGSIEIEVDGGVEPYQYSLNGGAFVDSSIFTGLLAGEYTITVQDNEGSTEQLMVTLENPAELTGQVTEKVDNLCFGGAIGSISVSGSGGTSEDGTYTYAINGGMVQNSDIFLGLSNGFYVISIFDDNQCEIQVTATISSPPDLELVLLEKTDVSCFGADDGTCSVQGFGGTSNYMYSIDDGPFGNESMFSDLEGGTHVIRVLDAEVCLEELIVFIDEPENVTFDLQASELICYGDDDATIEVLNVMGTDPFLYQLNDGPVDTLTEFTGLSAGEYTVTVIDSSGCTFMQEIDVNEPDNLVLDVEIVVDLLCEGDSTGAVQLEVQNGAGMITYSVDQMFNFSGLFANLSAGEFLASATDSLGCTTEVAFTLEETYSFEVSVDSITSVSCNGDFNGSVMVNVINAIEPVQYSIDGGAFQDSSYFAGLSAGEYEIEVIDSVGCTNTIDFSILEPSPLEFDFYSVIDISCYGGMGGVQFSVEGGTPPYFYTTSNGFISEFGEEDVVADLELDAGSYFVIVTDTNGCILSDTIDVMQNERIQVTIDSLVADDCRPINTGFIDLNAVGGVGGYQYSLNFGPLTEEGEYDSLATGNYTLMVFDSIGCAYDTLITIPEMDGLVLDSLVVTDVSCAGAGDGVVEFFIGNANGDVHTMVEDQVYSDHFIEDLAGGSYSAVSTDSAFCTLEFDFVINEPDTLILDVVDANLNEGCLEVLALGGTVPYVYSIDGKVTTQDSAKFTGLASGEYTVVVIDANGCESEVTYFLTSSEEQLINDVLVYPNPVRENLNIDLLEDKGVFRIEILNAMGQVVRRFDSATVESSGKKISLYVGDLALGNYWLRLHSENKVGVFAFLKI